MIRIKHLGVEFECQSPKIAREVLQLLTGSLPTLETISVPTEIIQLRQSCPPKPN